MATKRTLSDSAKDNIAKYVDKGAPLTDLGQTETKSKADKIKVTHYIRRDQVGAMDRIRAKRLEAGAELRDVDKSSLMREAIDLLVKQEKV